MATVSEILAIEKGIKSSVYSELTNLNKTVQRPDLFNGMIKRYQALEDEQNEANQLPEEKKLVQLTVKEVLTKAQREMSRLMDITARKEWANTTAKASVIVDGQALLEDVPVTYLLFLEKQLTDLHTLVGNLPLLDPGEAWFKSEATGMHVTAVVKTMRYKKTPKVIQLAPATKEHPEQAQLFTEDVPVGTWNSVKQSGAMRRPDKEALLERITKVLQAVKEARERANGGQETTKRHVGDTLFGYILTEIS